MTIPDMQCHAYIYWAGLSSLVCGLLFGFAVIFCPLFERVPPAGTSPLLILVGLTLFNNSERIRWNKPDEAVPAFFILLLIPFTYSIISGVGVGYVLYLGIGLLTGTLSKKARYAFRPYIRRGRSAISKVALAFNRSRPSWHLSLQTGCTTASSDDGSESAGGRTCDVSGGVSGGGSEGKGDGTGSDKMRRRHSLGKRNTRTVNPLHRQNNDDSSSSSSDDSREATRSGGARGPSSRKVSQHGHCNSAGGSTGAKYIDHSMLGAPLIATFATSKTILRAENILIIM